MKNGHASTDYSTRTSRGVQNHSGANAVPVKLLGLGLLGTHSVGAQAQNALGWAQNQ